MLLVERSLECFNVFSVRAVSQNKYLIKILKCDAGLTMTTDSSSICKSD